MWLRDRIYRDFREFQGDGGILHRNGKIKLKGRPPAKFAVHTEAAILLFHQAMHHGQPKTRTFLGAFGGKEWVEYPGQYILRNTAAGIRHGYAHVAAGFGP